MTRRKRLNVSDLFRSIGRWNDLYGRVIALNTLVFSSGQLHYSFSGSLAWNREAFEFHDCDGCFYTVADKNATLFLERQYGDSKVTFTKYERFLFTEGGEIIGLLLLIALYKLSTSSQLAIGVLLYIFCPGVHFTRSKTFARASLFLSGISVKMIRIPTMMHCMESLPQHLRVFGLAIMFGAGVISNLWLLIFVRLVSQSLFWTHAMVAVVITITCSLHIWLAPPSILNALFNAETVVLHDQLVKWVPEDELVNIDDLIDYVLYRGLRASLASMAYACGVMSSIIIKVTVRLILLEHVPTSVRSLIPLAFLYSDITLLAFSSLEALTTSLSEAYPNGSHIYSLAYILFAAPFALLLDNSTYMVTNSAEIPAYTVPHRAFPSNLESADIPSEHFSVRMMLDACAAAEQAKKAAKSLSGRGDKSSKS
ncbi:hypothetical protein GCK32_008885 [Trichostrongylus colubriformis]|uniref:Uncharacterized protein n=1 Tax=Trichostrongylus colubriformis TaxID=6319 RepID=A0AAN8IG89_TRICO